MSPPLTREITRLGGTPDVSFVPDHRSKVHVGFQHFRRVDWGGAQFDFYDDSEDDGPTMWLIAFWPLGEADGVFQIGHAEGGNCVLFLEDAAREDSEIGIFDHDDGVDKAHILADSLLLLLQHLVPAGTRRQVAKAPPEVPPMPSSDPPALVRAAWAVPRGALLVPYDLPAHPHGVSDCAIAPDRTTWATLGLEYDCKGWHREGTGWVPLWQGRTVVRVRPLSGGIGTPVDKAFQFVTYAGSGMLLVRREDTIAEVDPATGNYTGRQGPPGLRPIWAEPLPDGRVVIGCEGRGSHHTVSLLDPGLSLVRGVPVPFRPDFHGVSQTGSLVAVTHYDSPLLYLFDFKSARPGAAIEVVPGARVAVAPDGSEVAVAVWGGWILLCGPDGIIRRRFRVSEQTVSVAWSPDGTRLLTSAFTGPGETGFKVSDRATLELVHDRRHEGGDQLSCVRRAMFTPDGEWLFTCDWPFEARSQDVDPRMLLWPAAEMGLRSRALADDLHPERTR